MRIARDICDPQLSFASSPCGEGLHRVSVRVDAVVDVTSEAQRMGVVEKVHAVIAENSPELLRRLENQALLEERVMDN